jgi:hypothetical protein
MSDTDTDCYERVEDRVAAFASQTSDLLAEVTVVVLSPTRRDSTYVIQHAPQLYVRWALV